MNIVCRDCGVSRGLQLSHFAIKSAAHVFLLD